MNDDYIPQEILDAWPDCRISGCPNKCCRALGSVYCWPHTGSGKSLEDITLELGIPLNVETKELVEL